MITLHDIFELINKMVQVNKQYRQTEVVRECARILEPVEFAKDFGTVRFNLCKRCGKTEYIKKYATPNDCVAAVSRNVADLIYGKDIKTNFLFVEDASEIREYEKIYVEVSALNGANLNWVYHKLAMNTDQTFIILG